MDVRVQTTIVMLVLAFAASKAAEVKLISFDKSDSHDRLEAVYSVGQIQISVLSVVQPTPWDKTEIVSTVSVTKEGSGAQTLSKLQLPGEFLLERMIPDMENYIITAAKGLSMAAIKVNHDLGDLSDIYDAVVEDIRPRLNLKEDFSQTAASVIYHKSVIRAAVRITDGVSPAEACPPHPAYEHKGLFACQHEYAHQLEKLMKALNKTALPSSLQPSSSSSTKGVSGFFPDAEGWARIFACGSEDCKQPGCGNRFLYSQGWFITGEDLGCCGTYPTCCVLALDVCLGEDLLCACCSFPDICIDPLCTPQWWCPPIHG